MWNNHYQQINKSSDDRFSEKVNKNGEFCERLGSNCWEWMGAKDKKGYGRFNAEVNGRNLSLAHHFSWILVNGDIPIGFQILYHCDNPSCVNPSHLFLGTNSDNVIDKMAKGRWGGGISKGEQNGWSKLTEEEVIGIREEFAQGNISKSELGRKFKVSKVQISNIVNNKQWKYLSAI